MLEVSHVIKQFKRQGQTFTAVNDVSLSIPHGEILGLVGESGCGKSTLSKMIMQLLKPDSGTIALNGVELTQLSQNQIRKHRLDFQMVFQDPYSSLNPRLTVYSTLSEALQQRHSSLTKKQIQNKAGELLERVGMSPSLMQRYPHEFSGGQRQRIAIARALAPEPKLVIADEPVSALDVSIQSQILNLLSQLQRDLGLTMLFISHDLAVVRYLSDRVAVMCRGEIVEQGMAEEVFRSPQQPYTQKLLSAAPSLRCVTS